MWSEGAKWIEDIEEQKECVGRMDCFHDYRVGNIKHNSKETYIMIEWPSKKKPEVAEQVWVFDFVDVSDFEIELETVIGTWIFEILYEDDEWRFDCTNGYMKVKASKLKLREPIDTGDGN